MINKNLPKVYIIVLNWNGWQDTVECLESLQRITYPNFQIVLVDNNSSDDSVNKILMRLSGKIEWIVYEKEVVEVAGIESKEEKIRSLLPQKKLVFILLEKNLGYAGGNNVGIRYALRRRADYVLILNNDVVVSPDFLEPLMNIAAIEKKAGILGLKSYFYNEPNVIQSIGCKMNLWTGRGKHIGYGEIDYGQYDRVRKVDWVSGVAILVKSNIFKQVGLFDEVFYLCYEENDLCHRARRSGFMILTVPQAKIWHKAVRSSKKPMMEYYLVRNRLLFMKKNAQIWHFFSFFYCYLLGISVRLISCLITNNKKPIQAILIGLLHGFSLLIDKRRKFDDYGVYHF